MLWPEKPEAAARHSLNEAIRVLRRYLGESAVDTTAGEVRLVPTAVRLDVERLEELARTGEWQEAAGLIAGEFLEGFAVAGASELEDWLASERAGVRQRSVDVLVHRADQLLHGGQASEAVAAAVLAVGLDPRSERTLDQWAGQECGEERNRTTIMVPPTQTRDELAVSIPSFVTTSSCKSGSTWEYVSRVTTIEAWPSLHDCNRLALA